MALSKQNLLSQIPAVEILLQEAESAGWTAGIPRRTLVDSVRAAVDLAREHLLESSDENADAESLRRTILADSRQRALVAAGPHYRKVINATGIILHTALGRAPLAANVLRQIETELSGYSLLQADISTGERSRRDGRIESLLQQLTAAEAATVVNNNAAATAIVLNTVACGREVIVSRGQLVEIGGSFRLPDVMAASGVKLIEVGTTNKTHPRITKGRSRPTRPPCCACIRATTRFPALPAKCRWPSWCKSATPTGWSSSTTSAPGHWWISPVSASRRNRRCKNRCKPART